MLDPVYLDVTIFVPVDHYQADLWAALGLSLKECGRLVLQRAIDCGLHVEKPFTLVGRDEPYGWEFHQVHVRDAA